MRERSRFKRCLSPSKSCALRRLVSNTVHGAFAGSTVADKLADGRAINALAGGALFEPVKRLFLLHIDIWLFDPVIIDGLSGGKKHRIGLTRTFTGVHPL